MIQDIRGKRVAHTRRIRRALALPRLPIRTYHLPRPGLTAGFLVAALVFALVAYFVLPQATIIITPRTEAATRDFELRVDSARSEPSLQELLVPGKLFEESLEGTKKTEATGTKNVGKKASGFVSLYNFSKNTLILRAQTTTLTAGGKKYYFTQDVGQIRPTARIGTGADEEIDETSLIPPVPIVAAEPGESSNLPPRTRLEITNEAFGHQPTVLYAAAADAISGGSTRQVKVVTAQDISRGYSELEKEMVDKFRMEIVARQGDTAVLDNAFTAVVASSTTSVKEDTEAAEFMATSKLQIRALGFREDQVRELVLNRTRRLLPPNKILISTPDKLTMRIENVDLQKGTAILKVHFEGQIVYQIDQQDVAAKIRGKKREEVRELLLSRPEIQDVEVDFRPFWAKKVPKIQKRVTIDVRS